MSTDSHVPTRVAQRALARHVETYVNEVQRLLDAGVQVMLRAGTSSSPRVADIVIEAGLSNDAFYRHFPSKAALVAAILEDGAQRLATYIEHQMAKEDEPADKVRAWVAGILSQTRPAVAATARAVMANASSAGSGATSQHYAAALAALLVEPLTVLGSADPALHARVAAHAALGVLNDHLWAGADEGADPGTQPSAAELQELTDLLLAAVARRPRPVTTSSARSDDRTRSLSGRRR